MSSHRQQAHLDAPLQSKRLSDKLADITIGRRYFRRWSEEYLKALNDAARTEPAGHGRGTAS